MSRRCLARDLPGKLPDEVREAMEDKFPKHIYHEIIASALIAHQEGDQWAAVDLCDVLSSFAGSELMVECRRDSAVLPATVSISYPDFELTRESRRLPTRYASSWWCHPVSHVERLQVKEIARCGQLRL